VRRRRVTAVTAAMGARAIAGAALLSCALLADSGCGGGAGSDRPIVTKPPPPPPIDKAVAPGWVAIDEPEFFARIPSGVERRESVSDAGPALQWVAVKDGVTFTVVRRPLGETPQTDTEKIFDAAATAFFRSCRGARVRMEHADTLEHKTVTVDGTCSGNKPAMGQIHIRGGSLFELYIVLGVALDSPSAQPETEELRGFFRAFRVKAS
jgi:hypothetical protein